MKQRIGFRPFPHAASGTLVAPIPAAPSSVSGQKNPLPSQSGAAPNFEVVRLPVKNFMPPEGFPYRQVAYVAIPNQGANAVVVGFKVPQGRNGVITQIGNVFVGGGFQEGQGIITWQIYLDGSLNPPLVCPYFNNILASLGSVANPAQLAGAIAIKENQLVQLVVFNANPGVVPAGQLIGGLLGGYFYPKELEPRNFGF